MKTPSAMKILTNEKTIRRNAKIGQFTSLASLLILGGGMYVSFAYPTQLSISFGALLVGFILSQVGIYFGNRWGRRPRIDEKISAALKGLGKEYTLYHFLTPVNHLLVGPAGIWVIEPYYQRGTISFEKGKWKQKGGGFFLGYLKIFAQEGLGNPGFEVKADLDSLTEAFKKALTDGGEVPPVNAVLVFTDPRAELKTDEAPWPTLKIDQLKTHIRNAAKQNPLPAAEVKRAAAILPEEGVE
jgi:hypothetical protein